jgi:uncharacterized protein YfaT (DUF1175 family)
MCVVKTDLEHAKVLDNFGSEVFRDWGNRVVNDDFSEAEVSRKFGTFVNPITVVDR